MAASSSSLGRVRKNCLIKNIVSAEPKQPGTMMGHGVFAHLYTLANSTYEGMSVMIPGKTTHESNKKNMIFRPGKRNRANP